MNFSFENQGNSTYLVYRMSAGENLDSLSLGMITNNKIKGIAPILFSQMDMERYLKYNITAKVSVKNFFTGTINRKRILGVFIGIVDAMLAAEEYMIDTAAFILNLDYIFVDVTTCETLMICLPVYGEKTGQMDMAAFFKNIVFNAQYDPNENSNYVAEIVSYLNGTAAFSLENFGKMLKKINREASQKNKGQTTVRQPAAPPSRVQQPVVSPAPPQRQPVQATNPSGQPQGKAPPPSPKAAPQKQAGFAQAWAENTPPAEPKEEKKITMLHLLMHYDKATKAAYNAQKQREKQRKADGEAQAPVPKQEKGKKAGGQVNYAIPGVETGMPQSAPKQPPAAVPPMAAAPPPAAPAVPFPVVAQQQKAAQVQRPMPQPAGNTYAPPANFGETTVLSAPAAGATSVLGIDPASQAVTPHLVRKKNNERIHLNKPVFRVGKEKSFADYFIGDNVAVSRSHADFITRNGEYFVMDMNSTNHTYVDDEMIRSSAEVKLAHGMKIKLANEEFEFRIY